MKKALIAAGVVLVLAAVVVLSLKAGGRDKGVRVYVEEVERSDVTRTVQASGQIDPRVKVNISSHVIGKIEKLYVEEGDRIEAGRPFLKLETEAFVAARDQAAAQLAIARSNEAQAGVNLADAELKLARMERLAAEKIASAEQLEAAALKLKSAELGLEQARESVIQARAALDKAKDDLSKATIFAPLSGRVISLAAEEGEVVVSGTMNNPASVIGTIADLSEILAEVDVDETEIAYLEVGQQATLEVDALPDSEYAGRVVELGSSGFQRPQQPDVTFFKVKVLLADPDAQLRPGMSVRAKINTAERKGVLVVPIQAVVERPPLPEGGEDGEDAGEGEQNEVESEAAASPPGGNDEIRVVFVVEDGRALQRPVEVGISDATRVEIVAGVEAGQKVVTGPYRSLKKLEHDERVRVREEGDEEEEEEDEDEDES